MPNAVITYIKAWQCIGCGKIEAPQTCVGICQDRKVHLVFAEEHEQVRLALENAKRELEYLGCFMRRLACTSPRNNGWEHSYRAFQNEAREMRLAGFLKNHRLSTGDELGCTL